MKKILTSCALAALVAPAAAFADVKTGGEVYVGYGNYGYQGEGYVSELSTYVEGDHQLDNGNVLKFKAQATLRSDQEKIGYIDDDNIDLSMSLDMQSAGKLSFTTFRDTSVPWATGNIKDRGTYAVFPSVKPAFSDVYDSYSIMLNGAPAKVDREVMFKYENRFGKLGFEAVFDPFRTFGPVSGDEVIAMGDIPDAEIKLTYPTKMGIYSVAVNDLKDVRYQVVYPVGKSGLTVIVNHEESGDSTDTRTRGTAIYRAKNMGPFKGFFLTHGVTDQDVSKTVFSTNWGGKSWGAKVSTDSDGDYAIEANYKVTDNLSLMAGYDSGFDAVPGGPTSTGHDVTDFRAAVFAAPREEAFEIGLKLTF